MFTDSFSPFPARDTIFSNKLIKGTTNQQPTKLAKKCKAADVFREKFENDTISTNANCEDVHKMEDEFRQHTIAFQVFGIRHENFKVIYYHSNFSSQTNSLHFYPFMFCTDDNRKLQSFKLHNTTKWHLPHQRFPM